MLTRLRSAVGMQTVVAAAGVAALAIPFGVLHRLGDPPGGLSASAVEAIAAALAAGAVYFIILWLLARTPDRRAVLWMILAGAILFRLQLFPLAPEFSDDVLRYRWEGRVQDAGWNPYAVRPDDARLVPLRDAHWARVPGRDIPTIYPPLAELIYFGTYRAVPDAPGRGSLVLFKLPFLFADIAVVFLLASWITARGGRNCQVAIYAWNPLVIFEFAASGHIDAVAIAALVAAAWALVRGRAVVSTALLAAATLVKYFPAVLFPLWLRDVGWPRAARGWLAAVAGLAVAAICAWPYREAWPQFLDSLAYYESRWQANNASLWELLRWFSGSAELATGVGVGVVAGLALWAMARQTELLRAIFLLVGAVLLLSPNAFSWYFTWMVPLLALLPRTRATTAWLLLTVLQFLSYHVLLEFHATGTWRFQPAYLWLTYGPFYAVLLWRARGRAAEKN